MPSVRLVPLVLGIVIAAAPAWAQSAPPAANKPFAAVRVTLPPPPDDPSFAAFRQSLAAGPSPASSAVEIERTATYRRTSVAIHPYRPPCCADSETGDCTMHRLFIAFALTLAALSMATLAPNSGSAQGLPTPPGGGLKPPPPPPPAPVKPYKPVAVMPPAPFNDASFVAFRNTLADIAKREDRAALAKLIVAQGFFWVQDKDLADKSNPSIDNLAKAIGLDAKDGSGWDIVANYAADPTAAELPEHKGVICAPADPTFDAHAFEALIKETQTDPTEWGYSINNGSEVRAAPQPNAPVVDKLGLYFVRVLADGPPPEASGAPSFLHVALPSGKTGFVNADALMPLGGDQMCYVKDAGGWKIAGYIGGVAP